MFTLGMSKYADELVKLGFSDRLYCSNEDCKSYLEHCKKNNMIWLDNSYGTIVHKDFKNYFTKIFPIDEEKEYNIYKKYQEGLPNHRVIDHINLLKIKNNDNYILTASPYGVVHMNDFVDYPYNVYIIHPNLLDYHVFIRNDASNQLENPLYNVNYAFTNVTDEQMVDINKKIYNDIGIFMAFVKIK